MEWCNGRRFIYQKWVCCDSYVWWSGARVEDTRRGCVVILKYCGVVQWWKIAIAKDNDSALGHSRKLRQTYTRMGCVVIPKYGGVVQC